MENNTTPVSSPLDSLKSRMLNNKKSSITEEVKSNFGFVINAEIEKTESDSKFDFLDETETETETNGDVLFINTPSDQTEEASLLEKMRPFTTDDNGNDAAAVTEPDYHLDSVSDILKSEGKFSDGEIDIISNSLAENEPDQPETDQIPNDIGEETREIPQTDKMVISDIDSDVSDQKTAVFDKPATLDTATIRFTPIKGSKKLSVSSMTKPIEIIGTENTVSESIEREELAETEFEKFKCKNEIENMADAKKAFLSSSKKKRRFFILTAISFLATFIMAVITFFETQNMLFTTILLGINTALNYDMFMMLPKMFKKGCNGDVLASFCAICSLGLGIFSVIKDENVFFILLLCQVILFIRCLTNFFKTSSFQSNLRHIVSKGTKDAITLIGDNSTALAMAKNSIEGDVLIAGSRKTANIKDFMKYSTFAAFLNGKMNIISTVAIIIALVFGLISGFMSKNPLSGFFTAAALLCTASVPTLFFIDTLPMKSAVKRLNSTGAMITGFTAAEKLETANAVVVSSADIFPAGTVTLQTMKVLSDNNVDDVLMRASSLTEVMNSPLSPIFKKIAGTATQYKKPDSDTCKYEEKMGISGWVDNKLLFIGNRTLMEAHGISVPDLETDHKILKKGFFPVYVANESQACVLLVVKYSASETVRKRLNRIINLGVTLLIDNCDPNIVHDMICDNFGFYEDAIQIMTGAGIKMYKSISCPTDAISTPALYKGSTLNIAEIMTCASKMKRSNILLITLYSLAAILGTVYFLYTTITTGGSAISKAGLICLYETIATLITFLIYLI